MNSTLLVLFLAGMLTILLPCILPLLPIVLGVSIAGRSPWRPLLTILGMLVSFVGFTFLLLTVLEQFVELADVIRIATYYVLLLFGFGFAFRRQEILLLGAVAGAFFFLDRGLVAVGIAAVLGCIAMLLGGKAAARIQQFGSDVQGKAAGEFGRDSPLTAFIIGLTLGLVWVPCAGPALSFAFTLVREQPGFMALVSLLAYGLGTAVPLLAVGYGGQFAVKTVRGLTKYSHHVKVASGMLLILTALGLQFRLFEKLQILLLDYTSFGDLGTRIEERLLKDDEEPPSASADPMNLPRLSRAPELVGLDTWFNSEPLTMADLKGKVVLIDFWTYSCINCIRTLPYVQGYWDEFKDQPFVLVGVHSPEFVFEKSEANVRDAIERHGLTYPVAQDNDFQTWRAFANRYWPAKYLIDAEGYIRYAHFGEGDYEETEEAIRALLKEIGSSGEAVSRQRAAGSNERVERKPQSAETYLGERSWPALGNARGEPSGEVVEYAAPAVMELHKYYLDGEWQLIDGERQVLAGPQGEIRMKWLGGEMNLVLGLEDNAKPVQGDVYIDGKMLKTITVDRDDLFQLYKGVYGEHELRLVLRGPGVAGYAFTFGQGR
jgi:cytochrome c biogenesis protein CcdA/peroxiredoxin